ncbi:MAG: MBG domain-containing protein, partial [Desulfuromonadaceae bacterium]
GSTVTGITAGSCIIAANQAADSNYTAAAQATQNITIGKAAQTISFGTAPTVPVNGSGTVSATGGGSTSPVVLTSTTPTVCSISGSTVTGITAGSCIIAANQAADSNYTAAAQATQNITIGQATASVTLLNLSQSYDGTAKRITPVTTPSGLTVDVTYDGSVTVPSNAGTYAVVATVNDSNYTGTASGNLVIAKADQTISFAGTSLTKTYGAADFGPGAIAPTGLSLSYTSDNNAVVTIAGKGLVHIVGAGTATITATQAGDANYNSASATQVLTVEKAPLTVIANNASRPFGVVEPAFTANYSGFVNGENSQVVSGTPTFTTSATINSPPGSYRITPVTTALTAANYSFTTSDGTLAVGIASQNIVFNPLAVAEYGDAPFTVTASGGASGNPVVFSSSDTRVATVSGSTVTIVGAGEAVITASQAGNDGYASASAEQTLTVNRAILLVSAVNARRSYGEQNPAFNVNYSGFVNNDTQAVLSGTAAITTTASIDSPTGSYTIVPSAGTLSSANYRAQFAPATLAVDLASQAVIFDPVTAKTYGTTPFALMATGGDSGNPVTYSSSNEAVAVINGATVTIIGAGQTLITASQAGDSNYASATAQQFLNVKPALITVSAAGATRAYGASNPSLTPTYSGFVNGEDQTKLAGSPQLDTIADTTSPVNSYPITVAAGNLFSANYTFTYQEGTLTVNRAVPVIIWNNPADITYGTSLGTVQLNAVSAVVGSFSYTPLSGTVLNVGSGQTLSATFTPSDAVNYTGTSASVTINVVQAIQAISFGAAPTVPVNGSGTVSATGGGSTAPVVLTSTTPAVCTISGSTVTGITAGSCIIAANQAADNNYSAAAQVTQTITIGKAAQTISFGTAPTVPVNGSGTVSATGGGSTSPVVLTSTTPAVCSISGSTVIGITAGNCILAANQAADNNYTAAAQVTQTITIGKAAQTISFGTAPTVLVNGSGTVIATGGGSTAPVVLTSTTPAVCSISGSTVTGITADSCIIAANQAADSNYTAAAQATQTITIGKAAQTISFGTAPTVPVNGSGTVSATGGGSTSPVVLTSTTPAVCSISGSTVIGITAGNCILAANQAADNNYTAAAQVTQTITIGKAAQTISFGTAPTVLVNGSGTVIATGGGSTAPVVLTSTTPAICSISGSTVTGITVGSCILAANQAADNNYTAAAQVTRTITISQATASVTLLNLSQIYDGTAKRITPVTTPSGLTVDVTYDGSVTVPSNAGTYAVVATVNDSNYTGTASGNLVIAKADQTISFAGTSLTKTYGAADFGPGAIAPTGLSLSYTSDNNAVVTIAGKGLVHIVGAGTATITATQAGDANYNSASATQVLTVEKAPLTVIANNASRPFGVVEPAFTANYSGFVNGENSQVVSGTPTFTTSATINSPPGSYRITPVTTALTAANYSFTTSDGTLAVGIASQNIVFNPLAVAEYGDAPFTVTASGGASGNPVVFSSSDTRVATVSGSTVTIVGAGEAVITASQAGNDGYASASAEQTLTVNRAILLVSAVNARRSYGEQNPAFNVNYSGFVNNDTQAVLSGTAAITTTASIDSPTGSYTIVPSAGTLSSANYRAQFAPATLAVDLASQAVIFDPVTAKTYGTTPFALMATGGDSGNPVTYSSSNEAVAVINGATVTIIGAGQTLITASQAGDSNYASATAQQFLNVKPALITVSAAGATRAYGASNPSLTPTYSGFVNGEDQTKLAGSPQLDTIADTTSPVNSYPITVAAGNLFSANYTFTYQEGTLTVYRAVPVITWSNPATITYGTTLGTTQLNATANVAGSFSYTPAAATIMATGNGQTLSVTFTPTDTDNYTGGTASVTINVAQAAQTISFGTAPTVLVNGSGTVIATGGGSTAPVVLTSTTPAVCSISGSTVTGITAGSCIVAANQAADNNYSAAAQVTQTITIGKAAQTVTFGTTPTVPVNGTGTVSVTGGGSTSPVVLSSTTPLVCTIDGTKVTGITVGSCLIAANQAADSNYTAAASVNLALTVVYGTHPPTLTVSALSDGATTIESTQNISGKVFDGNGIKLVTVNGNVTQLNPNGTFSYPVQLIAGANAVTVVATSNAGLTTTDSRTITLDSTALQLKVSYPPDNVVAYKKSITVTGTIADLLLSSTGKVVAKTSSLGAPTTVTYSINGSVPQSASQTDTTYSFTTDLDNGMNTIKVFAVTVEGKKVEVKRTVNYELPTFSLAVTDPAADVRTVKNSYLLTGTVADNTTPVSITITMDGRSFSPVVQNDTFQQQLTMEEDKVYQITVSGTDQNNNV